jgi:hypothetical protein
MPLRLGSNGCLDRQSGLLCFVIWLAIACLLAPLVGSTSADSFDAIHYQETFKPYIARVYFDSKAHDRSDAYFEILKDGRRVYLQKAEKKGERFFLGTMNKWDPDAALVKMGTDITGDGQPDLVISEWLGGVNCCLVIHIFEIGPMFKRLGAIDAGYGGAGPLFIKDSNARALAVQVYDRTFANWNAAFADSPAPRVVLRFTDGEYQVAPDLMHTRAPSAEELARRARDVKTYAPSAKGGAWPDVSVSPELWGTMLDLMYGGHPDTAWKFLDLAWPAEVHGRERFARDFRNQLAKSKYWQSLE